MRKLTPKQLDLLQMIVSGEDTYEKILETGKISYGHMYYSIAKLEMDKLIDSRDIPAGEFGGAHKQQYFLTKSGKAMLQSKGMLV